MSTIAVMDWRRGRSKDVEQTLAMPTTAPASTDAADATFEALYRASRDDIYAYAAGLLRDRAAAEDVTAAAFERAYRKRHRYDPKRGTRRAWLFGIARNAALDELRRRGRQQALTSDPEDLGAADPSGEADVALRRATLRAALGELNGRERELVALKFFAGLDNSEIAGVLGISESNAGTKLHRTIEKLRRACDDAA